MPFYEYKCLKCGIKFEEFQDVMDDKYPPCKCGGKSKRLISRPTVVVTTRDSREYYENTIKPEAKRIADKIRAGDEDAAADIFGEENLFKK